MDINGRISRLAVANLGCVAIPGSEAKAGAEHPLQGERDHRRAAWLQWDKIAVSGGRAVHLRRRSGLQLEKRASDLGSEPTSISNVYF